MTRRLAAACLVLLLTSALSRAQTAPASAPAPAPASQPQPFLRASISSTDDIQKLLTDLALPIPLHLNSLIEGQLDFLTPGDLAADKPLGILVFGDASPGDGLTLCLPTAPGKATAALLTQKTNIKSVDAPSGLLVAGTIPLKRFPNYLLAYPTAVNLLSGYRDFHIPSATDLLNTLHDNPFADDYKTPGTLASATLNLALARTAAPSRVKDFLDELNRGMEPKLAVLGLAPALADFINARDRIDLALTRDDKDNLHLTSVLSPVTLAASPKFPRPAFPADCILQAHIVYPNADAAAWVGALVAKVPHPPLKKPANAAKADQILASAAKLFTGADAVSVALEIKDGKPHSYFVNQYSQPNDAAKELTALAGAYSDLIKAEDASAMAGVAVSTYPAGATTVTRVTLTDHGQPQTCIDLLQSSNTVTISIAPDDGKYVESIAALPAKGEISDLSSGVVDLTNALKALEAVGVPLPPDQFTALHTALDGKSITWLAQVNEKDKSLRTDISIPIAAVREVIKLVTPFHAGPPRPAQGAAVPITGHSRGLQFRLVAPPDDTTSPADEFPDPNNPTHKLRVLHTVLLDDTQLATARLNADPENPQRPILSLEFTPAGRETFARITTDHVKQQLAIVFEGKLLAAPVIQTPILGGQAIITFAGKTPREDAQHLFDTLTAPHSTPDATTAPTTQAAPRSAN